MNLRRILAATDHTQLSPTATAADIARLCAEAARHQTASVCVAPARVCDAKAELERLGVLLPVCTVIGFPNGYNSTEVKAFEARTAIENGADEIDIVISIGEMLDGEYDLAGNEIETLRAEIGDDAILKVILESGTLSDPELIHKAATIAMEAGADFIKTSTGKNGIAATPEAAVAMCLAIRQFAEKTGRKVGFKAAGGISTAESAALYYSIVEEILGEEWLTPERFRIGASSLANNLLSEIEGREIKYF